MELLSPGTELAKGGIELDGVGSDSPIVVDGPISELPHGHAYRAHLAQHRLLVTLIDPSSVVDPEDKDALMRGTVWARELRHGNLLPTHGIVEDGGRLYIVRADPQTTTVRQLIHKRMARGKRTDVQTACALGAQVCDAIASLHPGNLHLYVNPDTVFVTGDGRALLSATGEGALLVAAPGFDRFRKAGLLPNAAPELLSSPPRPQLESDVYGVGALVIELLTGRTVERAGQQVGDLGVSGPPHLLMCLQQAIEPNPEQRQPNILALRTELLEAARPDSPAPQAAPPPPPSPPPAIGMPAGPGAPPEWGNQFAPGQAPAPPPFAGAPPRPPPHGAPAPPPPGYGTGPAPALSRPPPAQPPPRSGPPPPPPPPPSGRPDQAVDADNDWSALDSATKRLVDAPSDSAYGLTMPVGGGPPGAAPGHRDPAVSASDLGLSIGALDDAAQRLETLDGERGVDGLAVAVDALGKRDDERSAELRLDQLQRDAMPDGAYFGSFAEGADAAAKPREHESGLIDLQGPSDSLVGRSEDIDKADYIVTRQGVDQGPYSLRDLEILVRKGELQNTDAIVRRSDRTNILAVDHPRLREIFAARARKEDDAAKGVLPDPRQMPALASSKSTATGSGGGNGTLIWLVVAIAVFAAAGWVLWQRSGGG